MTNTHMERSDAVAPAHAHAIHEHGSRRRRVKVHVFAARHLRQAGRVAKRVQGDAFEPVLRTPRFASFGAEVEGGAVRCAVVRETQLGKRSNARGNEGDQKNEES